MKTSDISCSWRFGARLLLAAIAALVVASVRVSAADAPTDEAAAPAPKPAAPAAPGTWFVFTPPASADEVLASASRIKMLTIAKTFLERDLPELRARLQSAENPFYVKAPPAPEPTAAATANSSAAAQPAAGPPKMSDEDKLKAVGEKLQPTGILEGAGRRLVTFSGNGGGQLEVGQSFFSVVPPDASPISVQLLDANDNSCVLKLNSATVTVEYVLKTSGASRSSPSSTSPSQPKP